MKNGSTTYLVGSTYDIPFSADELSIDVFGKNDPDRNEIGRYSTFVIAITPCCVFETETISIPIDIDISKLININGNDSQKFEGKATDQSYPDLVPIIIPAHRRTQNIVNSAHKH